MPYTEEFKRIRQKFNNRYSDKAKAETFAFEEAFERDIPTFSEEQRKRFKKNNLII